MRTINAPIHFSGRFSGSMDKRSARKQGRAQIKKYVASMVIPEALEEMHTRKEAAIAHHRAVARRSRIRCEPREASIALAQYNTHHIVGRKALVRYVGADEVIFASCAM